MLPLALVMALSPPPVIASVVLVVGSRARTNGPAFLIGWIAGIAALGAIVLVLADEAGATDGGGAATWVKLLKLAVGVGLVLLAVRKWGARPGAGDEVETPKWMGAIGGFTPIKAAGLGVLLSAANPKNVLLIVAAAATEAQTGISSGHQAIVWAIFTAMATVGVGTPVVVYFALGDRAPALLARVNEWMVRNNTAVTAVLCLLIGVTMIGNSISELFS